MWKSNIGHEIKIEQNDSDDWETDADYVNDLTEEEQRWGSKNGRSATSIDMQKLREETEESDKAIKSSYLKELNTGFGYGGKFGVEQDRMDKSAVGHDYVGKTEKHASQKDYSDGFGGKYGVQKDRVDKSALSWDHIEKVEKHASQKDYSDGFGGKYGVQTDRVDKSALGWDHVEKVEKHESQKDYAKGFGGKFGVQEDRKDKSALGWDHIESVEKHESQLDHKKGFGGKFGVQKDRMDKSAMGFDESKQAIGTNYTKTKPDIGGAKPSNLRAKFENLAKSSEEEAKKKAEEQKRLREEKDRIDREQASKKVVVESNDDQSSKVDRPVINTGRSGGIGNAISAFNQMQSPTTEQPVKRKEPIKIPRQESTPSEVIEEPEKIVIPPPVEFTGTTEAPETFEEPIYQNNEEANGHCEAEVASPTEVAPSPVRAITPPQASPVLPISPVVQAEPIYQNNEEAYVNQAPETLAIQTQETEAIYQNQEDIAEYIEDTGIKAIALYDYQAAADDEISFDPDEVITHIEMVSFF
ncbi:HCLS1 family protein [Megaselia abdita]